MMHSRIGKQIQIFAFPGLHHIQSLLLAGIECEFSRPIRPQNHGHQVKQCTLAASAEPNQGHLFAAADTKLRNRQKKTMLTRPVFGYAFKMEDFFWLNIMVGQFRGDFFCVNLLVAVTDSDYLLSGSGHHAQWDAIDHIPGIGLSEAHPILHIIVILLIPFNFGLQVIDDFLLFTDTQAIPVLFL